jgi:hypothetical protein
MRRLSSSFAVMVGAAALVSTGAAMAEPEIGVVVQQDYSGAVGTRAAGQAEDLVYFQTVFAEERVDTGEVASTSLQFLDDTNLYVGSHSSVVLDRFIYDPSTHAGEAAINFSKGAFRFVTGNIKTKEAVTLNTPTASMVIRGTHLLIFVLADGTSEVNVLEGAIDILPCQASESQRVNSGEAITITASCDTGLAPARIDDHGSLIPRMPTELAAVQEVAPAAGDEEEEDVVYRYEESGKGDDKDRSPDRGNKDPSTRN